MRSRLSLLNWPCLAFLACLFWVVLLKCTKSSIRWVHTSEVSRLKVWHELKYTLEHGRLLTVISVHIRIQSMLEAIEVVNQDTRYFRITCSSRRRGWGGASGIGDSVRQGTIGVVD